MGMLNVVKQSIEKGREKIKAYHGSPHDFDKFSTDNIGTGEGAQAFGRGLYFAQREGTAKSYRDALTMPRFTFDGKPADAIYTNEIRERWADVYDELVDDEMISQWKLNYLDSVAESGKDYNKASEELDSLVEKVLKGEETTYDFDRLDEFGSEIDINEVYDLTDAQRNLDSVLANMSQADSPNNMQYVIDGFSPDERRIYDKYVAPKVEFIKPKGNMYEVDIDASPDELLDYDTLLKDQPKDIQDKVFSAMKANLDETVTEADVKLFDELVADFPELHPLKGTLKQQKSLRDTLLESNGAQVMDMFASHNPKNQANLMQNAGIKGVKYADAQTRFSPKGKTHNYVIFDDKLIDISRKYGIPPAMASAVLAGTMSPEQAQAQTESTARQDMTRRERRANPPSEVLRNYSVGQAGKAIGEMGLGVVQGLGEGLDFFNSANIQRSVMGLPQLTPAQDALSPITDIRLLEDGEGRDNARTIGSLFSPI